MHCPLTGCWIFVSWSVVMEKCVTASALSSKFLSGRFPELQLIFFSPKDIMSTHRCITLYFCYTYRYILIGELKALVLPLSDLIFHLPSIWAPLPFLYHTTAIFYYYNASTVPQLFSSFSLQWTRLQEIERSHSTALFLFHCKSFKRNFF